jgi:transcriptional regulator of acetoin/glycerol metabolism
VLDGFERRYVAAVLSREGGVVARAAERAGVPRQTFFRLIRKHGLREAE